MLFVRRDFYTNTYTSETGNERSARCRLIGWAVFSKDEPPFLSGLGQNFQRSVALKRARWRFRARFPVCETEKNVERRALFRDPFAWTRRASELGRFALVSLSANANIDEFCGMRAELARVLTAARADRVNVTGGSRTARSRAKSRVRAFPAALSGRARRAVASPARCELAL